MKLPIGARLPHDFAEIPANEPEVVQRNRAVYRVTQVLSETPWSCLYRGKKVFRNFEFAKGTLTEAADDECLDVLIRTLSYPQTDDREYIKARREHSWFEAKQVLGCRSTNFIAEPLDYLEVRNDQDKFAFPRPGNIPRVEPVLVFETIQGDDLERWNRSNSGDTMRGLNVLAQTLDFLSTLHDAKFLLNVMSPSAFWVDSIDRVHFLGTENVVDLRRALTWRTLFPNERYAQGFVAPELLQSGSAPTRQSDLFGWASLVWQVLTRESSAKLAADQLQRWVRFDPSHRERLRIELKKLSLVQVASLKRLLKVQGSRFELSWPESFLDGLWSCLDVDPAQRPGSVEDLRAWWGNPPPPSVAAFMIVRRANGTARCAFSTASLRLGLQFRIVRKLAQPPSSKDDGDVVWEGTAGQRVELSFPPIPTSPNAPLNREEWCFSIFALESTGVAGGPIPLIDLFSNRAKGGVTASRPTIATIIHETAGKYRLAFACSLGAHRGSLPEEIALLGEIDPIDQVAAELLDANEIHIRGWGIALLQRGLNSGPAGINCRKLLNERGLGDAVNEIRQQAAGVLIRAAQRPDLPMICELAQRIGGQAVDDMIRAARGFSAFGVSNELIGKAVDALELQHRIVTCKVCQQEFRARELDQHLITQHHYVALDGTLLPFGQALTRLWARVVQTFDVNALQVLTGHLQNRHPQSVVSAFASALSQQVLLALQSQLVRFSDEWKQEWLDKLSICLQANRIAGSSCLSLLRHDDARIRYLARSVVLKSAALRLAQDGVTSAVFRDAVDTLVPLSIVNERIETCRRLIQSGANRIAGETCERELDLERLIDCPQCGTTFQKRDLPAHRRKQHQVFEWDGQAYDWNRLVPLLINRTVAAEPDAYAARTLAELFKEKYGNGGWRTLFEQLKEELLRYSTSTELIAIASGLGTAVGTLPQSVLLARAFMSETDIACQSAGLAIFSSLDREAPLELAVEAADLLGHEQIPLTICKQVAVHLLRQSNSAASACRRALLSLASRAADKLGGIELLQTLEQWVGPSPAIKAVCDELGSTVRIRCPRCEVVQTPAVLAEHVRTVHGLILEGRSVKHPWSAILECLDSYAENPKSHLLERAEQLADFVSPKNGRMRLWREMMRRDIAPPHYRQSLVESVAKTSDSLCPQCWENVPAVDDAVSTLQISENGDIQSDIASLKQVDLHGVWSSVEITPWDGPAPGWKFSRWGAVATIGFMFFVPAIAAFILYLQGMPAGKTLSLIGLLGGIVGVLAASIFYWPTALQPLDVAWEYIVPALLDGKIDPTRTSFLASLARATGGRGNRRARQASLDLAVEHLRPLVRNGLIPSRHLAELWFLRLGDASYSKERHGLREELLKELISSVLEGDMSLEVDLRIGMILERLHRDELIVAVWSLFDQARGMKLGAADVIELFRKSSVFRAIGKATFIQPEMVPHYFAVIELEQAGKIPFGLISTKQLISADKFSSLTGKASLLARSKPESQSAEQDAIFLSPGELEFRHCMFTSSPDVVVREKTKFVQTGWTYERADGCADQRYKNNPPVGYDSITGYTLKVGTHGWEYTSNPTALAARIRTSSIFLFGELQLHAEKLSRQIYSDHYLKLLKGPATCCPRCQTPLKLHPGGIAERQ